MTIFVDTSAFLAALNRNDQHHERAVRQWQASVYDRELMFTNNYVLIETIALLQQRLGLAALRTLEEDILRKVAVIWLDADDHQLVMAALLAANRRQVSLVDHSAMATMRLLDINRVFTFDSHFDDYSFERLPN